MNDVDNLYLEYQERFALSGCISCSARKPDRIQIPKGFIVEGNIDQPPIMFVLGRPSEEDEIQGRLLSSSEKNKFKAWISAASGGRYPTLIVTAALRCNSINNKSPSSIDLRTCSNLHLYKEICFMRPGLIVSFGNKALSGILNTKVTTQSDHQLLKVHNTTIRHPNFTTPWVGNVYALYHPSFFEMGLGGDKEQDCINLLKQAFKANYVNNV